MIPRLVELSLCGQPQNQMTRLAQEIPVGSLVLNLLQDKGLSLSNQPTKFTVPNSGFQE
jgi:hypothetical protein